MIIGAFIARPLAMVSFNESFANNIYNFKNERLIDESKIKKSDRTEKPLSRIGNFFFQRRKLLKENEKKDWNLDEYFYDKDKDLNLSVTEKIKFLFSHLLFFFKILRSKT